MDLSAVSNLVADWIVVITTGVSAIAAIVAAFMARNAVDESRRLRKATTYPEIAIYLDLNPRADTVVDLVIRNIGAGPASDVHFETRSGAIPFNPGNEKRAYAIEHGLSYLPPGKELRYVLDAAHALPQEEFTVTVSYSAPGHGTDSERLSSVYTLTVREFDGMLFLDNTERQAQKSLKAAMDALLRGKVRIATQPKS